MVATATTLMPAGNNLKLGVVTACIMGKVQSVPFPRLPNFSGRLAMPRDYLKTWHHLPIT
jgi:hypothetical protein